jgi:4-amino-4-deoxy-L-arabinose transferase-like glycosyltransferase
MFFGLGLPLAMAVLPRPLWRDRICLAAAAMALGPAFLCTIMFLIGTIGTFNLPLILFLSGFVAVFALVIALRQPLAPSQTSPPLSTPERAIIVVVAVAVAVRFLNTAYWPFTTYDALWVYGYNARIFMLEGQIPTSIGYYPQLVPLAYTYGQLAWGSISDHAARAVLPYFALGSILMSYVLAGRLFGRRAGLIAMLIWAFYPHHSIWSQFGDLEVTLAFYCTGAAAFFISGWRGQSPRQIILSGLLLGAALWTKPTSAAFAQSLILIGIGYGVWWWRGQEKRTLPMLIRAVRATEKPAYPLLALIAAAPMGGMWYIRNVIFGHPPLVFPSSYWQDEAQRSGQEMGWPLLIMLLLTIFALWQGRSYKNARRGLLIGFGLCLAVTLLSVSRFGNGVPAMRFTLVEYLILGVGGIVFVAAARPLWAKCDAGLRGILLLLAAFITPYLITWFWSYSYHYRLSFAIVPLFIAPLAALLSAFCGPLLAKRSNQLALAGIVLALAAPGWLLTASGLEPALAGRYQSGDIFVDDDAKIAQGNRALMGVVQFLRARRAELNRPLRIVAPNELRLPFFFPQDTILDIYPTQLDSLEGIDYFLDSSAGQRLYAVRGQIYNQVLASRTRSNAMQRVFAIDDGNFRFGLYTISNDQRFSKPAPNGPLNLQVGDLALLHGYDLSTLRQVPGGKNLANPVVGGARASRH